MPSKMDEIAARSAKSASEYVANKKANDALAAAWRGTKKKEDSNRKSSIAMVTATAEQRAQAEKNMSREYRFTPKTVLKVVEAPIVVSEPPIDLVDFAVSPKSMEVEYNTLPGGGVLYGLPPVVGTMMVMLGKRLLVSMAVTGLNVLAMEPLQQYGKGLPRANVLWHTGRSARNMSGGVAIGGGHYDAANHAPSGVFGTGYAEDDPFAAAKAALHYGSDASSWLSEQIRSWFGFPNWMN